MFHLTQSERELVYLINSRFQTNSRVPNQSVLYSPSSYHRQHHLTPYEHHRRIKRAIITAVRRDIRHNINLCSALFSNDEDVVRIASVSNETWHLPHQRHSVFVCDALLICPNICYPRSISTRSPRRDTPHELSC